MVNQEVKSDIWAVVLAAGASVRMGKQKMLLPFGSSTILEKVIGNALNAVGCKVVVVTGSNHNEISNKIKELPVKIVYNHSHNQGMLSSVIAGVNELPPEAGAFLLFLGDQPQIPFKVAETIVSCWKKHKHGIIIPVNIKKRGHPVLIETRFRQTINNLNPDVGLKELMIKHQGDVFELNISSPEILRDIDTPEDYSREKEL